MRHILYASIMVVLCTLFAASACAQSGTNGTNGTNGATGAGAGGGALGRVSISFSFRRQSVSASNQIAVWIENESGAIIKTLYISRFTGNGGFSYRPDSLSAWTAKAKPSSSAELDAFTSATPNTGSLTYVWDCTDGRGNPVPTGTYRYRVEGTLYWASNVLFTGSIPVGEDAASSQATAVYSSTDTAHRDMLRQVQAVFTPKK